MCAIMVFTLVACDSSDQPQEITVAKAGYTCNASVKYNDITANIHIKALGGGIVSIKILTPEEVSGLTFEFDNSDMKVIYGGLSTNAGLETGYGSFAELLNGIFLKLTTGSLVVSLKDGAYVYEGQSNLYPFTAIFNTDGFITQLTMTEAGLTANFSGWQY